MRRITLALAGALLLLSPFRAMAQEELSLTAAAEAVEVDGEAVLIPLQGAPIPLEIGMKVRPGHKVRTGAKAHLVLRYSDGSEVGLGAASQLGFLRNSGETRRLVLLQGELRALIQKKAREAGGKPSYFFRTRTAVLGVRGTDFVYGFDPASGRAEVHTLEGVVEMARDEESINKSKGVPVAENQALSIDVSKFGKAEPFDRGAYLQLLQAREPFLTQLERPAPFVAGKDDFDPEGLSLRRFQLGLVLGASSDSNIAFNGPTPEVAWAPVYHFSNSAAVRWITGFHFMMTQTDSGSGVIKRASKFITSGPRVEITPWAGLTIGFGLQAHFTVFGGAGDVLPPVFVVGMPTLSWRFGPHTFIEQIGASIGGTNGVGTNSVLLPRSLGEVRFYAGFRL